MFCFCRFSMFLFNSSIVRNYLVLVNTCFVPLPYTTKNKNTSESTEVICILSRVVRSSQFFVLCATRACSKKRKSNQNLVMAFTNSLQSSLPSPFWSAIFMKSSSSSNESGMPIVVVTSLISLASMQPDLSLSKSIKACRRSFGGGKKQKRTKKGDKLTVGWILQQKIGLELVVFVLSEI